MRRADPTRPRPPAGIARLLQDGHDVLVLSQTHLKGQRAPAVEGGGKVFGDGPVEIQAVGPAVQGHVGLVLDLRVQGWDLRRGDIGRVADDEMELAQQG